MDIRTKLVFALVAVALVSMASLGVFTVLRVEARFEERTDEQLNGLAVLKQEALEQVLQSWKDRVTLVASRTQLRLSLAEHNRSGASASAERIERILSDAAAGSPSFLELWVHDLAGDVVAGASRAGSGESVAPRLLDIEGGDEGIRFTGIEFQGNDLPVIGFTAPLRLDGALIGHLHAILSTDEIEGLSGSYEGLGDSGETMVVARDERARLRTLHPVRFPPEGFDGAGYVVESDRAAAQSLAGGDVRMTDELTDYRGRPVYITTRHIMETDWGLVVKIDAEEQQQPIIEFRQEMTQLAVTLAACANRKPIHVLAETAGQIAEGDLSARAELKREDEVGLLARTFDQMAESLEEQVGLLTEFRRFFDVSIDMLCIASTDGYFKRVNRACVRELGWSEEELLSRPFISFVHQDDHRATAAQIQELAKGQPTIRFTNRFLCADGSYKRVRWNAYPEAETGRLYAIARVRSEQPGQSGDPGYPERSKPRPWDAERTDAADEARGSGQDRAEGTDEGVA